ncbi:MAG TPA: PEP/pyruvate-binding domain-containing protein [Planctomycetota bacterium]|nr:PEP/pyruvate-binding domain-containing protein [Planctomycetota bacterium]
MTTRGKWIFAFGDGGAEGDPERKDVLGGKGASLAAMSRAGLPVPPGFTISVECCRQYHENGTWPEGLEEEVRDNLARLEQAARRDFGKGRKPLLVSVRSGAAVSMPGMMDTLLNCGLHPGLADEVEDVSRFWQVYAQFIVQFGSTVADIPDEAFKEAAAEIPDARTSPRALAETYRTLYERRTGKPFPATPWQILVECINAVFDSWYNERAVAYRKSQDIRGLAGTAANVQTMFPSEVSGIAFTANPADPYADEIVIESSFGLGEAIVSGLVTPDLFVLDYTSLEIKDRTLGKKVHAFTAMEETGRDVSATTEFSLSDDEVRAIAELALEVEEYFGYPVDLEWGVAGGEIALLQARAIRGLDVARDMDVGRKEEIERLKALASDRRKVWVVHNLGETLRAPTPLTWDITRQYMSGDGGYGRMYQDFGHQPSERVRRDGSLELICGCIYVDPDRAAELFWGNTPLEYDLDELLRNPAILETGPKKFNADRADGTFFLRLPRMVRAMLRSLRLTKRARASARERLERDVLPDYLDYVRQKRDQDLTDLPTPQVLKELDERIERVLGDFGKESGKPGYFGGIALSELEKLLVQLMGESEGRALAGTLTSGLPGDTTIEQNIMLYRVARGDAPLEAFLERYGHRAVGEMELAEPRWREDPSYLRTVLVAQRREGTRSPEETHAANERNREAVQRELPGKLTHWGGSSLREQVTELLHEAQLLLPYREIGKHYLMMGYEIVRQVIVELGRRWDLGRDVFFLELDELRRFEGDREALAGEIAARKVRWRSAQRLSPAEVIDSNELDGLGVPRELAGAREFEGLPLAPGVTEGTVRIVFRPDEAGELPGDCILVCPSTDPGWTTLFASIRGLVVERGGVLSHGAITARDFGIPALACHDATRHLEGVKRIRVDGGAGQITVLDDEDRDA